MPPTTTSLLKSETANIAKRINLQNALPGAMKALPLVAIGAGGIAAKIAGGTNVVEDRLLGTGSNGGDCRTLNAGLTEPDTPLSTSACVVIGGISDYADSHKNDEWQPYAAAAATGLAKEMLCYLGAGTDQLEVEENDLDDRSSNKCISKLPGVPKPANKHKGELVTEFAGTCDECRDITWQRTLEDNHNVSFDHSHIRAVAMPQATSDIQLCHSNSKYCKTTHDALLSAMGDLSDVEGFDGLRYKPPIPRFFGVKAVLINGLPSPSEAKYVEDQFFESLKDEDVQRYTRIGSFDEMGGERRCHDNIFEIPMYQGARCTCAATLWLKVVDHDKREEEIGILLNPVENAEFHVKIWHIEALAHDEVTRTTLAHGEQRLSSG
ncbi:hypothetical protein FQN50_002985 [Emmonsiellopsis sp. PD_5]|nr:hypothetical protein FQN50_002985 [Emmonsiellopsis sp. PD_5]